MRTEKHNETELGDGIKYYGNKGPKYGTRHTQVLMGALGNGIAFATKSILSVVIVAMTDTKTYKEGIPTYDWKNTSVIISSILWSGLAVNLLAGYLGKQYGPKWLLVGAGAVNSVFFMLIPLSAEIGGSTAVIVCRLIQGFALGIIYPLNAVISGRWVPPEERSRMGFVGTGLTTLSVSISSICTGFIADSSLGWPWVFYIFGAVSWAWVALYAFVGVQSPQMHKSITEDEKKYLHDTLSEEKYSVPTPWIQIFTSVHFWAIVIGQIGSYWIIVMLSTEMSIFLAKVMEYDVKTNGIVSAIPPLVGTISGVFTSILSDYFPNKGIISVLNSRRIFHIAGVTGVSVSLIIMTYIPVEQRTWSIVLLCFGNLCIIAAQLGGCAINILDISPKNAGIIMGFALMVSQAVSLFAPLLVQWICIDLTDASLWRTVFFGTAALGISSAIFFAIFATDQRQDWCEESEKEAQLEVQKRKGSIISLSVGIGV